MAKSKTATKEKTAHAGGSGDWPWDEMIAEFRELGGTLDNLQPGVGDAGPGLFPIDPALPGSVRVPPNLLFRLREIEFRDGALRANAQGDHTDRDRAFFDRYQAAFSWGAGAREDCLAFFAQMDSLPQGVRDLLKSDFELAEIFDGDIETRAQTRYLKTRMIAWKDGYVLMPVLELANHASEAPGFLISDEAIAVSGTFAGEFRVRYNVNDPFGVFGSWGFVSDETMAYSLKMRLTSGDLRLNINRSLQEKQTIGDFLAPTVKTDEATGETMMSYALIGHARFPRLAKGIFYRLMRDLGQESPEDLFDHVVHYNQTRFFALLAALEAHEGPTVVMLRKLARRQLEAMSYSLGARAV